MSKLVLGHFPWELLYLVITSMKEDIIIQQDNQNRLDFQTRLVIFPLFQSDDVKREKITCPKVFKSWVNALCTKLVKQAKIR